MGPLKCCVGGCTATSETRQLFSFPKNDELRNLWMSILVPTNPSLLLLSKGQLLEKRVCKIHFDEHQFDREGRRIRFSYPCLFSELEIAHGVPLNKEEEYNILSEHNYFQNPDDIPGPSNDERSDVLESGLPDHAYTSNQVDSVNFELPTVSEGAASDVPEHHHNIIINSSSSMQIDEPKPTENVVTKAKKHLREPTYTLVKTNPQANPAKNATGKAKQPRKTIVQITKTAKNSMSASVTKRLEHAQSILNSELVKKFNSLSKHAKTFIMMQLKNATTSKMSRRFTEEEKLMSLGIMKQSPKAYRLLQKMFNLPSKRTLNRLSENIECEPGVNPHIFKYLKETIKNWDTKKRLCSIVYDEVSLTPHISFDEKRDKIIGFVDVEEKKKKFCDHAIVFMIRGICDSWRQCVAYYFIEGTISAIELKNALKQIVEEVVNAGFIPLALVSDQGSTFRTTIKNLREEKKRFCLSTGVNDDGTVQIAGQHLSVFYDPPHLLKGMRNNFMNKDVIWEGKTATWKDILYVYDIDSKLGHTRALPKLSDYHVNEKKMKKMKVSIAAQVLSARTAAILKYTNAIRQEPESTMETTANFVEFVDRLFDSVNGYPKGSKKGKLRKAVKPDGVHLKFWQEAVKKIKLMKFKAPSSNLVRVPSLDGWITTLESFIRLSKILFADYNVDFYYPRYINQDPLENFFGRVRALNYRNVNPDAITFKNSFKTLLLSNILSPHSQFSNCEEDKGETVLNLNFIFNDNQRECNKENVSPNINIEKNTSQSPSTLRDQVIMEKIRVHCSAYTAGFLCRKMTKYVKKCRKCIESYTTTENENTHQLINYREFKELKNKNLCYPNETFLRLYRDCSQTKSVLPFRPHKQQFEKIL